MATPPDFTAGQVLTAAQMNAVGLWLIKTQTIGTTVSSVNVTGAFSADYDNYLIHVAGGSATTADSISLQLGSTTTGYYWAFNAVTFAGVGSSGGGANSAAFLGAGLQSTNQLSMQMNIFSPFAADETWVTGRSVLLDTANGLSRTYGGFVNNTTSYTDFTIIPGSGTMTGGTIYVYGMRD